MPRLAGRAIVHGHCHHEAIMGLDADRELLDRLGLDYEVLDDGCCGLAGSFGYEAGDQYEVSMLVGEQKLLPAVRETGPETLLVTDGFSCRSQIEHGADRRPVHLAEVLALAYREQGLVAEETTGARGDRHAARAAAVVLAGTGAMVVGALLLRRRRR